MKKLIAWLMAALITLTLTSCQTADDTEPEETGEWQPVQRIPNRPGEYFTDFARTFSIGDRTFTFDMTFDEARELFGEDMKTAYPDGKLGIVELYDGRYMIHTAVIDNGYYWGLMGFVSENENGENAALYFLSTELTLEGSIYEETGTRKAGWYENGDYRYQEFPFEFMKIPTSINDFTTGISTREQIHEYFGDCTAEDNEETGERSDAYLFEDYSMALQYTDEDVLSRITVVKAY